MTIEAGRKYVLINAKSGTALDLSGSDNVSVLGWEAHRGENQQWELHQEDNQWVFCNVHNGKFLGIERRAHDNVPVRGVDAPVKWNIFPDDRDQSVYRYAYFHDRHFSMVFEEYPRIFVPDTPFNIDLSDFGNPDNGTLVTIWGKSENNQNQTWRFEEGE
ncbi:hypothetical protein H0H93_002089 [Arthromyces matolae]|nr:hypothetical protein H0H93_002089 [Arthromyces matolae]